MATVDSKVETMTGEPAYQPGADQFVLVGLTGPAAGMEYPLDKPFTVIGRSTDCDVCVSDDQVYRRHVQFALVSDPVQPGRWFVLVQDLKSRNGIRVNGWNIGTTLLHGGEK